jgi:hypothetical protein
MSVPVRGSIRPDKNNRWLEEISRRIIALEKASGGAASVTPTFASPATPAFGSGSSGGSSTTVITGATDHGALTGKDDDDHPQYHKRGEPAAALPHLHTAEELGLDPRFYRRGESVPANPHTHRVTDVVDLRADDEQFVVAGKMFGG